ncbi:hypothetical protein D1159_11280 [Pseudoflavonifractor sp. 524-17]|uniref:DHHW family protein n=1 Tax=Pseudoflavonifractor sp. 524-17 TaxID=2304577 RepID=UPI00137ABCF7|nr:DHHW family protein [Pseudoflavonifractor sp. 524-17]NCE65141.1 hypothetical protein [Pseudoflavonifractor sp. 524-17]
MPNRAHTAAAVLFLTATLGGFCYLLHGFLTGESQFLLTIDALGQGEITAEEFLAQADGKLNADLDREHLFIQLYGGIQRLTGRRVLEDMNSSAWVVKLDSGALTFASPADAPADVTPQAQATAGLKQTLDGLGIPLLFVTAPYKIQSGGSQLPPGLSDHYNGNADRLLERLEQNGVNTLDLRPAFAAGHEGWFFRTDHHWTPQAAFFAWQNLVPVLERNYGIATPAYCTDQANYDQRVYENWFLGSQGKRTGSLYAGVDDITQYLPRFDTDFTYTCPANGMDRRGPFGQSLLFPERVAEKDWFNANPYTLYSGGDYGLATITNHRSENEKKILLIRESFSCALTPFLALSCSQLTTVDLRYFEGDLTSTIAQIDPDLVLILYSASSVRSEELFQFH